MLTLANITDPSTAIYDSIEAVLVVGNPYHIPNATLNIDEYGGDLTRKYPGAGYDANNASSRGIAEIYYQNGKLLDICHTEDIVCAPGYPNASFAPGHLHYGDSDVQDLGKKFLVERLSGNSTTASAGAGGSNGTMTGSSSPAAYTGGAANPETSSLLTFVAVGGLIALML